ncbi:MAG: rRNA (guanosine2251-2-O)-methyltransferase, partial [Thermodesulfobacteriota bacterium]|nr:rRNA (guanosine2251-2-O)-methyltransferase [Thermodesulfobacteriota bacterium]
MMKTEMLYGVHPVFEALRAGRREFFELYVAGDRDSDRYKDIIGLLSPRKVPVKRVKPAQIEQMTGQVLHQGIAAKVSEYPLIPFDDILKDI